MEILLELDQPTLPQYVQNFIYHFFVYGELFRNPAFVEDCLSLRKSKTRRSSLVKSGILARLPSPEIFCYAIKFSGWDLFLRSILDRQSYERRFNLFTFSLSRANIEIKTGRDQSQTSRKEIAKALISEETECLWRGFYFSGSSRNVGLDHFSRIYNPIIVRLGDKPQF